MIKPKQAEGSLLAHFKDNTPIDQLYRHTLDFVGEKNLRKAMRQLIKLRQSEINLEEYRKKLREPVKFNIMNTDQMKQWFLATYLAKEKVPVDLDKYSEPVIDALCMYFSDNPEFESLDQNYSLGKGILLHGNVGCGKSSFLNIFQQNQKQSFRFASCPTIAREFSQSGYSAVNPYFQLHINGNRKAYFGQEKIGWFFDDLGFETHGKHFGKDSNIMLEILQSIYDKPEMRGKIHTTTNLTSEELGSFYGERIRSRMREMFNVITYDPNAPDRRK